LGKFFGIRCHHVSVPAMDIVVRCDVAVRGSHRPHSGGATRLDIANRIADVQGILRFHARNLAGVMQWRRVGLALRQGIAADAAGGSLEEPEGGQ
jgi:hypothetical protein